MARPRKYDNAEDMDKAAADYMAGTTKPTITGLALALGFESRQSFYDYVENDQFSYTIKRLRLTIENKYEEKLHDTACTGAIFALKNMGWKDKTEQDLNIAGSLVWNEQKNYTEDDKK